MKKVGDMLMDFNLEDSENAPLGESIEQNDILSSINSGIFDSVKSALDPMEALSSAMPNLDMFKVDKFDDISNSLEGLIECKPYAFNDLKFLNDRLEFSNTSLDEYFINQTTESNWKGLFNLIRVYDSDKIKTNVNFNDTLNQWQEKHKQQYLADKIEKFKEDEAFLDAFSTQLDDIEIHSIPDSEERDVYKYSISESLKNGVEALSDAIKISLTQQPKRKRGRIIRSLRQITYHFRKYISKLIRNLSKEKDRIIKQASFRFLKIDIRRESRKYLKLLFRNNVDEENIMFKIENKQFLNLIFNYNETTRNNRIIRLAYNW